MSRLMLSCKKATELIEKQQLTPLRLTERFQLKLHKKMCAVCSAYEKQSILLDKALNKRFTQPSSGEQLSHESKDRIITYLKKEHPDSFN